MTRPVLQILIASTRQVRVGDKVGAWFIDEARQHGAFEIDVVDLRELDLPFMDEPNHPRLGKYQYEHTIKWSQTVSRADAFVFVHPEYNFGYTAPLKNAIDYLSKEWNRKPVTFVSYGGVSGGLRAAQMLKQVVTTVGMVPAVNAVPIPFVAKHIEDNAFVANDIMKQGAHTALDELLELHGALSTLRR